MAEITRFYTQDVPEMRFVGKRYLECDKVNNTFSAKWEEWFKNGWFKPLEVGGDEPFEDCKACYGLSRCKEDGDYEYYIGAMLPMNAPVPAGYDSLVLPAGKIGVCWVCGKEPDIYFHCCLSRLKDEGYAWASDENGVRICFERYVSPRFTTPDAQGNITLDMCHYVK